MLARCSTRTQVPVLVASTKVALSLRAYVLQNLEEKDLQGCIMSGSVLVLCKGKTTSQDMGDTLRSFIT